MILQSISVVGFQPFTASQYKREGRSFLDLQLSRPVK